MSILVVDDDRKTVDLVRLYLERAGYDVRVGYDGRQALELARKLGQGAPFVVLAEYLSQETMLEALRAGASGCLPRELQAPELSHELSRLLEQARS